MTTTWLFDCDNTLYSADNGFFDRVETRIQEFMALRLGIREELIGPLRDRYRELHGVTLVGLMDDFSVDPGDYLSYVHDVRLDDLIAPDHGLAEALSRLEGDKHVFTNGTRGHAERVLAHLGVSSAITEIFDIEFMDYRPKPRPHGYMKLVRSLGVTPQQCVMVDDMVENLETARELGMGTILVGGSPSGEHHHARTAELIPGLQLSFSLR